MKLVTFSTGEGEHLGALIDNDRAVLDLTAAGSSSSDLLSMQRLIEAGDRGLERARTLVAAPPRHAIVERDKVRLLAPLPRPIRMRDCSLFLEHMEAAMRTIARQLSAGEPDPAAAFDKHMASGNFTLKPIFREQVIYYNCDCLAVSGPDDEIVWPSNSTWMDYELEWACIIGKSGSDIPRERARSHIFGYTIFNDWSARDVQFAVMQANLGPGAGKDFALSNGLGPCIVTPDEFADPYALTMTARINGEEWSRGTTGSMHHSFEDAIVQFSRERALVPGEMIGSGTVLSGCGLELGRRLAHGDIVELEIDGIGILRNRVSVRG